MEDDTYFKDFIYVKENKLYLVTSNNEILFFNILNNEVIHRFKIK